VRAFSAFAPSVPMIVTDVLAKTDGRTLPLHLV